MKLCPLFPVLVNLWYQVFPVPAVCPLFQKVGYAFALKIPLFGYSEMLVKFLPLFFP